VRYLVELSRWLRVQHAGAPRWFLGFALVLAGVIGAILATHWGG
jgi:hypothetical protein